MENLRRCQEGKMRSGRDLHPRVAVLQTAVLATSPPDQVLQIVAKKRR